MSHDWPQSNTDAMRIAISPSLRIGAGLLLAALLSIVGYQVFLHTSSAPEVLPKRADDGSRAILPGASSRPSRRKNNI
jgi:hypothetical protein